LCLFSNHLILFIQYTAKLYIFGKSRTWLIEISMSSLSSVVTLWDNLGQRSNPYFKKKCYQTLTISFLRTFIKLFSSNVYQLNIPLDTECFVHCLFSTWCSLLFLFNNIFLAYIFRCFYTKNSGSGWEMIKVYNPI
jgi:hypothetical protein